MDFHFSHALLVTNIRNNDYINISVLNTSMNPGNKERIIHEKVLEALKKSPKGFTMTELVRGTKFSRKAIEKHLQVLILENEIYMKQFGVTKVYYPNHRIHHFDFEKI